MSVFSHWYIHTPFFSNVASPLLVCFCPSYIEAISQTCPGWGVPNVLGEGLGWSLVGLGGGDTN